MAVMEKVKGIRAGERIAVLQEVTVAEPCQDKTGGSFYCVTHHREFRNPMEKDDHIRRGAHTIAWRCWTHGYEQP